MWGTLTRYSQTDFYTYVHAELIGRSSAVREKKAMFQRFSSYGAVSALAEIRFASHRSATSCVTSAV